MGYSIFAVEPLISRKEIDMGATLKGFSGKGDDGKHLTDDHVTILLAVPLWAPKGICGEQ